MTTAPSRKIDPQLAVEHDEGLIGILVVMPDEIALQTHDLELVIVHFRNDFRLPLLTEEAEFLLEVDGLVVHGIPSSARINGARVVNMRLPIHACCATG
jgi:hypothetical protein